MLMLVIRMCLLVAPDVCVERTLPGLYPPVGCVIQGQIAAAEYMSEHPKWFLDGWRCDAGIPI